LKANLFTSLLISITCILFCISCTTSDKQSGNVNISDFGLTPETGEDASRVVRKALEYCKDNGSNRLTFEPGRYDFYPDYTYETFMFISNNHDGLKGVAFLLRDMEDFEIYAPGAVFVFHGYTMPFLIENCKNIKLTGFSIDIDRTFQSEGVILQAGRDQLEVYFPEEYPFSVENERLKFYDNTGKIEFPFGNLLEFDPNRKETAYMVRDYYIGNNIKTEQTSSRTVKLHIPGIQGEKGNIMVFAPNHRLTPNIVASYSNDVEISDVTMHNSGGMGFIAQFCKDITIHGMVVTPSEGKVVSCTADATHFSNCKGTILIEDCLFENQMDDATNVHGIYMRIEEILSPNKLIVRLVHHEQLGMQLFKKGENIEFVDAETAITYGHAKMSHVNRLNKNLAEITFSQNIPGEVKLKDVIGTTEFPEIILRNSIFRNNRARGVLLGSRESILVEGCTFHIPGSAIMTGGDLQYWFEQGGVHNMTIRNNVFDSCMFGNWGSAVITIGAGKSPEPENAPRFNRNLIIENNEFYIVDPRLVNATSVDGLIFKDNKIVQSEEYPLSNANMEPFTIERSINVEIDNKIN
jgi:hypothetical protein